MAQSLTSAAKKLFEIILKDLNAKLEGPGPNFWLNSQVEEAKDSLDAIFDGPLSREEIFDKLKEIIKDPDEKLQDWLPHKATISMLSAFERDSRARHASRDSLYALPIKRIPVSIARIEEAQDRLVKIGEGE